MALEIHLKPVEALLFRSDVVAVGKFRCPATHPLFRDSGPCSHHTFVFPRTVTGIRHAGGASFTGLASTGEDASVRPASDVPVLGETQPAGMRRRER